MLSLVNYSQIRFIQLLGSPFGSCHQTRFMDSEYHRDATAAGFPPYNLLGELSAPQTAN